MPSVFVASLNLDLKMKDEEEIRSIVYNLSHTLKRACGDLRMCRVDTQQNLAEMTVLNLLCRLLPLLRKGEDDVKRAFLGICPHVLGHMLSDGDRLLDTMR